MARLGESIRTYQRAVDEMDEAFADALGVSRTELRCIDIVDHAGRISAGDLAREARITTGAVTALVDRMEKAGYLRRVRDDEDRRRVWIEVTPTIHTLSGMVYGPLGEAGAEYVVGLSDDELEGIVEFLTVGTEITLRHSEAVRRLAPRGSATRSGLKDDLKGLKQEAKRIFKAAKADARQAMDQLLGR